MISFFSTHWLGQYLALTLTLALVIFGGAAILNEAWS